MTAAADLPTEPDELTPEWLTAALAPRVAGVVVDAIVKPIPARGALFSRPVQVELVWDPPEAGPPSIVAKLTATDPEARRAAQEIGVYAQEVRFYAELAPTCGMRAPRAWYSAGAGDTMVLLLDDLLALDHRDAPSALDRPELESVLGDLAAMHARWWANPDLDNLAWLVQRRGDAARNAARYERGLPRFLELHGDLLDASMHALLRELGAADDVWAIEPAPPFTLVHGDPKPSNIFFDDRGPIFVDWQGVCAAHASADIANALGSGLADEHVDDAPALVEHWIDSLGSAGVELDRSTLTGLLRDAARHYVVRAVSASVTTDAVFHQAHGVMTRRRIGFALSLS